MSDKGVKINDKVKAWSGEIKSKLTIDKETGVGSAGENEIFNMFFEQEGITQEDFTKVNNYKTIFVAASTHAAGQLAIEAMSGNQKLDRAVFDIAMDGKDNLSIAIDRTKTYPNHLGDGNPVVKYGVVSINADFTAGKNAGQLAKVRADIGRMALEALKS